MQNNKQFDELENLRSFIAEGPFSIRKIEDQLNISRGTVSSFLKATYNNKKGETLKRGLGENHERILEYMKKYGYKSDFIYTQFI